MWTEGRRWPVPRQKRQGHMASQSWSCGLSPAGSRRAHVRRRPSTRTKQAVALRRHTYIGGLVRRRTQCVLRARERCPPASRVFEAADPAHPPKGVTGEEYADAVQPSKSRFRALESISTQGDVGVVRDRTVADILTNRSFGLLPLASLRECGQGATFAVCFQGGLLSFPFPCVPPRWFAAVDAVPPVRDVGWCHVQPGRARCVLNRLLFSSELQLPGAPQSVSLRCGQHLW